jgi:hypothetical protein
MLHAAGEGSWAGRTELAVETEQPEVVTVRAAAEGAPRGVESDDLLAVEREDARRVVRAGTGLEAPEAVAVRRVVRL